jgi:hypothetical protein
MTGVRLGFAIAALVAVLTVASALIPITRGGVDFSLEPPPSVAASAGTLVEGFRVTRWPELMPDGWDPFKEAEALQRDTGGFTDADARAADRLKRLRAMWDRAPVNAGMDGSAVRMVGYVVPLEHGRAGISEFLLVPYFGACIHTPPPPSNQIIDVTLPTPLKELRSMDAVWVSGELRVKHAESAFGASGYRLKATRVQRYQGP